ncbi:MAG: hypothetical protein GY947_01385 [Rhodobacteraceae bacterium]|nr:hypothetical protein [Paracoccaceae bacterium]
MILFVSILQNWMQLCLSDIHNATTGFSRELAALREADWGISGHLRQTTERKKMALFGSVESV